MSRRAERRTVSSSSDDESIHPSERRVGTSRSSSRQSSRTRKVKEGFKLGEGVQKTTRTLYTLEEDLKLIEFIATDGQKYVESGSTAGYIVIIEFCKKHPEVLKQHTEQSIRGRVRTIRQNIGTYRVCPEWRKKFMQEGAASAGVRRPGRKPASGRSLAGRSDVGEKAKSKQQGDPSQQKGKTGRARGRRLMSDLSEQSEDEGVVRNSPKSQRPYQRQQNPAGGSRQQIRKKRRVEVLSLEEDNPEDVTHQGERDPSIIPNSLGTDKSPHRNSDLDHAMIASSASQLPSSNAERPPDKPMLEAATKSAPVRSNPVGSMGNVTFFHKYPSLASAVATGVTMGIIMNFSRLGSTWMRNTGFPEEMNISQNGCPAKRRLEEETVSCATDAGRISTSSPASERGEIAGEAAVAPPSVVSRGQSPGVVREHSRSPEIAFRPSLYLRPSAAAPVGVPTPVDGPPPAVAVSNEPASQAAPDLGSSVSAAQPQPSQSDTVFYSAEDAPNSQAVSSEKSGLTGASQLTTDSEYISLPESQASGTETMRFSSVTPSPQETDGIPAYLQNDAVMIEAVAKKCGVSPEQALWMLFESNGEPVDMLKMAVDKKTGNPVGPCFDLQVDRALMELDEKDAINSKALRAAFSKERLQERREYLLSAGEKGTGEDELVDFLQKIHEHRL